MTAGSRKRRSAMLEILTLGLVLMIVRNHVLNLHRMRDEVRTYGRERA